MKKLKGNAMLVTLGLAGAGILAVVAWQSGWLSQFSSGAEGS